MLPPRQYGAHLIVAVRHVDTRQEVLEDCLVLVELGLDLRSGPVLGTEDQRRWTPPSVRDPKKLAYAVGSKAIEPTIDPSFFSKVSKSIFWNSVIAGISTELLKYHEIILKLCTHKTSVRAIVFQTIFSKA